MIAGKSTFSYLFYLRLLSLIQATLVEQYFSAKSLVSSRSFVIDDCHGYGMVPLADLFNHKIKVENIYFTTHGSFPSIDRDDDGDNSGISLDDKSVIETRSSSSLGDDPDTLEMIVVRDVQAGAEVFNTYDIMGNDAFLYRYGFTELDNTFDIVNMDLDLVLKWLSSLFSNRYSRSRFSLWRKLNYFGCTSKNTKYFEISFDGKPQIKLIILLFIVFLPEDAYHKLSLVTHSYYQEADESANLMDLININRSK